jgi:hypothetical protein
MSLNGIHYLMLLAMSACTAAAKRPVARTASELAPANCPKLPDWVADAMSKQGASKGAVDSLRKAAFMNIVIDDKRAAMNISKYEINEAFTFHPPLDPRDILSITPLSPSEGARWYRSCPGVEVIMIRTKSGKWGQDSGNSR